MKLVCILGIVLGLAAHTRADVGVIATGETATEALTQQVEAWLHDHGRVVHAAALSADAVNTMNDCFVIGDLACVRSVVDKQARPESVVFVHVDIVTEQGDGTRDLDVSGYWLAKQHEVIAERRSCKRCTDRLLHEAVDNLMLALAASPPIGDRAPPAESATSQPTAITQAAPHLDTSHVNHALPIATIVVGGAAVVAGVAMIVVGGPPSSTTQQFYRDYRTPGYVVGGAGVVVAAAGIFWLLHSSSSESAPTASMVHGGATFGWAGRF
jgi:hypothetical protein